MNLIALRNLAKLELTKRENNSVRYHAELASAYDKLLLNANDEHVQEILETLQEQLDKVLLMQFIEIDMLAVELLTDPSNLEVLVAHSDKLDCCYFQDEQFMEEVLETELLYDMWESYNQGKDTSIGKTLNEFVIGYDMVMSVLFSKQDQNLNYMLDLNDQLCKYDCSLVDVLLQKNAILGYDRTVELLDDVTSEDVLLTKILPLGYRSVDFEEKPKKYIKFTNQQ